MLFQVDTLENLVIFELIRCKFKQSTLPALISKAAFANRRSDEYSRMNYESKFRQATDNICDNWTIPGNLTYLKDRIIIYFRGFVSEILQYGKELIKSLKRYDFRVKFCIERICLTQSGRINKAKTVLNILKDSQFQIEFHNGTLFLSMVLKKDLDSVSEEVQDTITDRNSDLNKVLKVVESIEHMVDHYFMDVIYVAKECVSDGLTINVRAAISSCFTVKNYEGLRRLCDYMDLNSRQKVLIENKYNFISKFKKIDGEMIQYLFHNLPRDKWKEMLNISFEYYFKVLIYDWRCSGFAVTVFKDALEIGAINVDSIIYIFTLGHVMNVDQFAEEYGPLCWNDSYSAHEKIKILKTVWLYTPIELKNDMKKLILESEDIRYINAESLMSVVDSYPVRDQVKIIRKVMEDINSREFADYKVEHYNKLYNMYLILISKSHGKIVINKRIIKKFQSFCKK